MGFAKPEAGWMVVDVWESPRAFADFSSVLVPVIQKTGVNVPEPKIIPAHNVYEPETEKALDWWPKNNQKMKCKPPCFAFLLLNSKDQTSQV